MNLLRFQSKSTWFIIPHTATVKWGREQLLHKYIKQNKPSHSLGERSCWEKRLRMESTSSSVSSSDVTSLPNSQWAQGQWFITGFHHSLHGWKKFQRACQGNLAFLICTDLCAGQVTSPDMWTRRNLRQIQIHISEDVAWTAHKWKELLRKTKYPRLTLTLCLAKNSLKVKEKSWCLCSTNGSHPRC